MSDTNLTHISCWLSLFIGLLVICPVKGAEEPLVLPLWPGAAPGDYGTIGPERVRAPSEAPTKDAKWITGVVMHLALKRANVATELHVYAHGGHGFGVRRSSLPCSTWTDRCAGWLQDLGMLGTNAPAK